jgi:glyoxylase-like metal-dependent hydrolase (beta-lactamase superfamily II)
MPVSAPGPDRLLRDGDVLRLGELDWRVLHTPGHSPGSITLHQPHLGVAIVGDALFAGSIGRTDFPGSDFDTLARSIRERLYTLPGSTRVLPGHGEPTTIARERAGNPFVRG